MKKLKIIFWISTTIIFLLEGVMPALTSQTELAKEGISHLGYPAYFGVMLTIFKVLGSIALIVPQIPKRVKEWAYAGMAIDFIGASVSHWVVDGFRLQDQLFVFVVFAILIVSYVSYHKIYGEDPVK